MNASSGKADNIRADLLPEGIARCATRWGLLLVEPLAGGYLSQVFSCTDMQGNQLVLKFSPPEMKPHLEASALQVWSGRAAVTLRDWDPTTGALLLDRVYPGAPLPPGQDDIATRIAAGVLRELHSVRLPIDHPFPTLAVAFDSRNQRVLANAEPNTIGLLLFEQSLEAARRLWSTARESVLLHGDFIDKNLLLGLDGYVAIDPMPRVGDPCADIGMYAAEHPPARAIATRARALAEVLGHDPLRAERWAAVFAVGGACETWRSDSDELEAWMSSQEAAHLLSE